MSEQKQKKLVTVFSEKTDDPPTNLLITHPTTPLPFLNVPFSTAVTL